MILTRSLRGIERQLEVWWDTLPLANEATFHIAFADDLPLYELTDAERVEIEHAADEVAAIAQPASLFDRLNASPDVLFVLLVSPMVGGIAGIVWSALSC